MAGDALALVHVDAALIVADKPAGLLSVPGRSQPDCLAARVQARHADALVVHRLDMATSGLVLFARGAEMQRRLNRAFAERQIVKRYIAVVHGRVAEPVGQIDLPLLADWPNRPKQKVDLVHGKPSLTRYRVLEADAESTRLALEPVSGRAHQLRVHLAAIGHPILGDALYAPERVRTMSTRLLLHAEGLAFVHPATGAAFRVDSPAGFADVARTARDAGPPGPACTPRSDSLISFSCSVRYMK